MHGWYVSLQAALSYYELIPEYTPITTSVAKARPGHWETTLGTFDYHHIRRALLCGYKQREVSPGQFAFVATPEKALLDLIYLTPYADRPTYLDELRLQNLDAFDVATLQELARTLGRPKLQRAADHLLALVRRKREEFETV